MASGNTTRNESFFVYALGLAAFLALAVCACKKEEQKKNFQVSRTTNIKVVAGGEFGAYLPALNNAFMAGNPVLADGSRVVTDLVFEGDLKAASRIANGELKAHGWIAPSLSLVNLVNKTRVNLGPEQGECSSLFETPVVAAAQERFARQLDPARTGKIRLLSLLDIPNLPSLAGTWSAVALSHAHPVHSLSGLAAFTQLLYLAAGSDLLNTAFLQDQNFRRTLARYSTQVVSYPLSDEELLRNALIWQGKRISLALTTEQAVKAFNNTVSGDTLQTLGLEDGTFSNVYHLCTSKADWVTPAHAAALRVFRNFLQSEAADATFEKAGYRRDNLKHQRDPSVGRNLPRAPRTFSALPGELVKELLRNWPLYRRPYATILVLDTSTGMAGDPLDLGKKYFSQILELDTPGDVAALINFGGEAKVVSPFASDKTSLLGPLKELQCSSGNAMHQALQEVLRLSRDSQVKGHLKKVIVFTDANNKASFTAIKNFLTDSQREISGSDFAITLLVLEQPNSEQENIAELFSEEQRSLFKFTTPLDLEAVFKDLLKEF